jgi:two-component system sensor histidine kinase MtrB
MADALQTQIDELAAAAERERRFTSDAAHDLRTPLTGLSATAVLLEEQRDEMSPELQRIVSLHCRDVDRLRRLVLDLLELARLDSGSEPVSFETLDLRSAIGTVLDATHVPPDVVVDVEVPEGVSVRAERLRFRRILDNVLTNAIQHGGGPIEVRAVVDGDVVRIDVRDHGPGIPEEIVDRVFDRFFKSDESRSRGGSGLGLAIARDHARAQGGELVVANAASGGACFTLTLPTVQTGVAPPQADDVAPPHHALAP